MRVLATLRRFVREGTPWRSLSATHDHASGATLRRTLDRWARTGLLVRMHATLVAMLRGDPTLIVDSCSVRAKRGGGLVGPNPTDRAKMGTKYHVAVSDDGTPVACVATGANVTDTLLFERLFLHAFAVVARIRTAYADRSYDAETSRVLPTLRRRVPHRQTPTAARLRPGHETLARGTHQAWLLENRRLALRTDRLGFIVQSVLRAACLFLVAGKLAQRF